MSTISVIMPVYNVSKFVQKAIDSVLKQTFEDFELIIVDDCSSDDSFSLCMAFNDDRIRIIRHTYNKGLAASRNTGIRAARGRYIALLDADDAWHPDKLKLHNDHLNKNPNIGLSYSRSEFMEAAGGLTSCYQMPRLSHITPAYLFMRNPIGNGSAAVIRRETLDAIAFKSAYLNKATICYFDEQFRRSEDIECWLRIALTTPWEIAGISQALTYYRLNSHGLSSNLEQQFTSWKQLTDKLHKYAPAFAQKYEQQAEAFQLRYLARQAVRLKLGKTAIRYLFNAVRKDPAIIRKETGRTFATGCAALLLVLVPHLFARLERTMLKLWGWHQQRLFNPH